mgnify:CR=1 FL=1
MCMDDPTGGMWIYFIFFLIPLARILPRIIRKFKNKGTEQKPEQFEGKSMWRLGSVSYTHLTLPTNREV